ncbi:MAG: isochorismatase family protein [Gemmatimonadetes bacterium]|jgi:nicotinamidase-related amidase|nr:isochorismatase family protein [Gemmatimonadota bacterium]MBT4612039.1 isochorismatase family protein [Gemmatimonadota bacterium]MBT5059758.1 isochorismatase family protein [Gemmatimonadota bacterium]MBT5143046.1 isochorismatase family protein [Gemmatimonadota bacterium]MBT5588312.1 isochorismatase family protein [Gemmatimonadota bacterium]
MSHIWDLHVDFYHLPRLSQMTESRFHRRQLHWRLPAAHTALILVDVWSEHYITTHLARGAQITRERIAPLMRAFSDRGGQVIHAPSPSCEPRYAHLVPEEAGPRRPSAPADLWPPSEFRAKTGDYADLARPQDDRDEEFERIIVERGVIEEVEPAEGDQVIFDGDQLHRLLSARQVHTLFYVGFAANMCVLHRDYGMRAMAGRGYDVVLVRDATTAIEMADTVDEFSITDATARDVEVGVGYTITTADLLRAGESA